MSQIRRISNSEVSTWKRCPRKWWLAWHRGLAPRREPVTGALAIGGRVHEALADVYQPGNGVDWSELRRRLDNLLEEDRRSLARDPNLAFELIRFDSEASLQQIMLEGYVKWLEDEGVDEGYEIIAAEEYVEAPLIKYPIFDLEVLIIGRLDVRVRRLSDGKILFWDHKTTGETIAQLVKQLPRSPQMKHYRLILELLGDEHERPGGAVYSIMRKVKRTVRATPPFYHRETVEFNPREIESFKVQLRSWVNAIINAELTLKDFHKGHHGIVPPNFTRDCDWDCPFNRVCPMFDDGSRVEDAIAADFVPRNPLTYYGRDDLARHDNTTLIGS